MFKHLTLIFICFFAIGYSEVKVYDCFMFFNELDILEIRLNELYDHVDKFVLVEHLENHHGQPKPYYFEQEKKRFQKSLDKIIHVKLDKHFETDNPWDRENWQRNQIMLGLKNCNPDDIILISDVDEIISGSDISKLKQTLRNKSKKTTVGFWQKMFRWHLNRPCEIDRWAGTVAVTYRRLSKIKPQGARNLVIQGNCTNPKSQIPMMHSGWHFTSCGGYKCAVLKYQNIVERDKEAMSYKEWRVKAETFPLVPIDQSFPLYVQKNVEYFKNLGFVE